MGRSTRRIVIAILAVVVLAAGVYLYDFMRLNLWIERDAGKLEDYPIHLIENGTRVQQASERYRAIDRILIEELSRGRNVVNMSRHEIKLNFLRNRAYAKVFLETAAPEKPELRSSLKLICEFDRTDNGWKLAGPPREVTLE